MSTVNRARPATMTWVGKALGTPGGRNAYDASAYAVQERSVATRAAASDSSCTRDCRLLCIAPRARPAAGASRRSDHPCTARGR